MDSARLVAIIVDQADQLLDLRRELGLVTRERDLLARANEELGAIVAAQHDPQAGTEQGQQDEGP